jgi:hypothetical protein
LVVIPEMAQQLSGTQTSLFPLAFWVPVFASGETGMTTNGRYFTKIESSRFVGGPNLRRMTWTLRRPAPGLTLLQQLLWPLIFAQLVALKSWVRAQYGRGVHYGYVISPWGRVRLIYVGIRGFTTYSAAGSIAPVLRSAEQTVCARLMRALAAEISVPVAPVCTAPAYSVYVHLETIGHDSSLPRPALAFPHSAGRGWITF